MSVAILFVFVKHFHGIPTIDWADNPDQKEKVAREIQLYQLGLVFPAVVLALLGLSGFSKLMTGMKKLNQVILIMPRWLFCLVLFGGACAGSAFLNAHYLHRSPQIIDSHNYYFQARIFKEGRIWVPSEPTMEKFFNFMAIMDTDGRRYGSSFPGHPFFLAIGEFLGVAWLVNPGQGGLIVVLIYMLGTVLFSEGTGRLAGILALCSPFRLFQCSLFMAHPTATLWILVALVVLFHYFRENRASRALFLGFSIAILYLTRPQSAAPVLLPFGFYYLWFLLRGRVSSRHVVLIIVPLVLAITGSFFYNKQLTGDYFVSPRDIASPSLKLGFGADVGRPLPGGGFTGHSLASGLRNTRGNLQLLVRDALGWGGWTVIFLILGIILTRARTVPTLLLLSGLVLMGLFMAYPINSPLFGARYYFEWLPLYLLLLAQGMSGTVKVIQTRTEGRPLIHDLLVPVSSLGLVLFVISSALLFLPAQIDRYYREIKPNTMGQAVKRAGITEGIVFYKGDYFSQAYAFVMNDPLLHNKLLFANDRGDRENILLFSRFPHRAYYRLNDTGRGDIQGKPIPYHPGQHAGLSGTE